MGYKPIKIRMICLLISGLLSLVFFNSCVQTPSISGFPSLTPVPIDSPVPSITKLFTPILTVSVKQSEPSKLTTVQPEASPSPSSELIFEPTIVPTVSMKGMMLNALSGNKDVIFYIDASPTKQEDGIWAINRVDKTPIFIPQSEGLYGLGYLSPSRKHRLITGEGAIYIASPDGTQLSRVFHSDKQPILIPHWLSDSTIIFNAFEDYYTPPEIYMLNIDTGLLNLLDKSRTKTLQNVFPELGFWIELDWFKQTFEITDLNGNRQAYFGDYEIISDPWTGGDIDWVKSLEEFIFIGRKKGDKTYQIWTLSKDLTTARSLFDLDQGSAEVITISPNEHYIAFVYTQTDLPDRITFVDLRDGRISYQWASPYKFGSFAPIWSPDSNFVVIPYSDPKAGEITQTVDRGIQVMDIQTGMTEVLLHKNIYGIIGWENIH